MNITLRLIPAAKVDFLPGEIDVIVESMRKIFESGRLITGEYTRRFEEVFAFSIGRKYCVATANDTAAIEIALRLIDVKGKKVIMPANGFFSVVIAVERCGGIPLFLDIDLKKNLYFTAEQVEEVIDREGGEIAACVIMHTGGLIAEDAYEIRRVCQRNGIKVVEDAAHAHYSRLDGILAGNFGDYSCFSFYATKALTCGEGGAILMDDEEDMERAKIMRNYGRVAEFGSSRAIEEGYNWRLTEFQAAVGLARICRRDEIITGRQRVAKMYDKKLTEVGLDRWKVYMSEGMVSNYYRYMLYPDIEYDRQAFKKYLGDRGISLPGEVYDVPIPEEPIFKGKYDKLRSENTSKWCKNHFCLPIYHEMTEEEVNYIVEHIRGYFEK